MCTLGRRECLSLVTFKKTAGTAIIQCGMTAESPKAVSLLLRAGTETGTAPGAEGNRLGLTAAAG